MNGCGVRSFSCCGINIIGGWVDEMCNSYFVGVDVDWLDVGCY